MGSPSAKARLGKLGQRQRCHQRSKVRHTITATGNERWRTTSRWLVSRFSCKGPDEQECRGSQKSKTHHLLFPMVRFPRPQDGLFSQRVLMGAQQAGGQHHLPSCRQPRQAGGKHRMHRVLRCSRSKLVSQSRSRRFHVAARFCRGPAIAQAVGLFFMNTHRRRTWCPTMDGAGAPGVPPWLRSHEKSDTHVSRRSLAIRWCRGSSARIPQKSLCSLSTT